MKKLLLLTGFFLLSIVSAYSTHIVGGDISVKRLTGNTFEVKVLFFRDCSAGTAGFDNSITIGVFDKVTNTQALTFTAPIGPKTILSLGDPCFTPNVCVEQAVYKANVVIPNNPNGYYIAFHRCCRNGLVTNILNPLQTGMTYYTEIPDPAITNNSPVFGTYPRAYLCQGEYNFENFSATDPDGDSLVYSLVTPIVGGSASLVSPPPTPGPYGDVQWKSPYSLTDIVGGTPKMSIHSGTGIITAKPPMLGVFVFAVKVEEYRNGIKIGEIRRDVQYQVISCPNSNIPGPDGVLTCANPAITLTCGSTVNPVTYNWNGPGIVTGGSTSNVTVNQTGLYTVTTTKQNGCTNTSTIAVTSNTLIPNVSSNGEPSTVSCSNPIATLSATSSTPNATFSWSGPGVASGGSTANVNVNAGGTYTVTVTDPVNGCTKTTTILVNSIIAQPNLSVSTPQQLTCSNTSTILTASSTTSGVNYLWTGGNILSGANTASPTVNAAGTYTVTVTNPVNGCTSSSLVVLPQNISQPDISLSTPASITCTATSVTLNASSTTSNATYLWNGTGIVSGGASASPTVNQAGTYTVTVTNPLNGCTKTSTVLIQQNTTPPNVSIGGTTILNCTNTSNVISANSTTPGVSYSWAGPGIVSGNTTSSPTVNIAGTYTVTITNPANGCTNTATVGVVQNSNPPDVNISSPSIVLTCNVPSNTLSASSTVSGATYSWAGSGIVSGGTTSSPTVNTAGIYTVTVTNPANGCTKTSTASVAQNISLPNITAGNSITLTCTNPTGQINASSTTSGATYLWTGSGIVSGTSTSSPIVNSAGTYTVVVTNPANGCTNSATLIVNQNMILPNVSPGINLTLTCTSPTGWISASSTTVGVTYAWVGPNILSGNNNSAATVNAIGTYTVYVTNPQNGCTNTATVNVVSDNSLPNLTTGPNLTLTCVTTNGVINANSNTSGVSYSWNGPGIVSGNFTPNPTVNTSGSYTITVTDPNTGCQSIGAVNVVNDTTAPNIIMGSPFVINCAVSVDTINVTTFVSNANYNWNGPGIVSGNNTYNPVVNTQGTYTVMITNPVNGCTNTGTVTVAIDTVKPDAIPGNSITLSCADTANNIYASSFTGGSLYSWSGPGIVVNGNTASPTVNAPGTYTVVITNPVNYCSSTTTVFVAGDYTKPNVLGGTPLILTCTKPWDVITASSITPNVTYLWTGPNILSNANTPTPTVSAIGTYTVMVTDPSNGCTNTDTVIVTVDNSIPNVTATTFLTLTCINTADTIFASSTTPGVTYLWTGPGIVLNAATPYPTVNAPGTYTVTVTEPVNGCTGTAIANVGTNYNKPIILSKDSTTLTCKNNPDTIGITVHTFGVNYAWTGPGIVSGSSTSDPTVNAPGVYYVIVTDTVNGCTSTDSIFVNQNIVIPNVVGGNPLTLTCVIISDTIFATSTNTNVVFNWQGTSIVSGANTSSPIVNGMGMYIVTVTDTINGCTNKDTVLVNIDTLNPNVTGGPQLTLTCLIGSSNISATSTTTGVAYNWYGSGIVSGDTTATPIVNAAGTYTVVVTNPKNGCTSSATVVAVSAPLPVASTSVNATITLGNNTTLYAGGGVSYLWSPATGLSCTNCYNPVASPDTSTTYCVIVTDQYGCKDSACVRVEVYDPCPPSNKGDVLPNVFTPNGDGDNDLFLMKDWNNECIVDFSMEIYNRWGLKIYTSEGATIYWDGRTASGVEATEGIYFYVVKIKKVKGKEKVYKGDLTLVR